MTPRPDTSGTSGGTLIPGGSALRPFVRRGIDGGCILCHKTVASHIDARGAWTGCPGQTELPANTPFLLIPDRRFLNTVAQRPVVVERRQPAPVAQVAPPAAQAAPQTHRAALPAPRPSRVAYRVAGHPSQRAVASLPQSDAKVYKVVAGRPVKGATRGFLLAALHAEQSTGVVDGAVRRLRLKGLIKVVEAA